MITKRTTSQDGRVNETVTMANCTVLVSRSRSHMLLFIHTYQLYTVEYLSNLLCEEEKEGDITITRTLF